MKRYAWVVAVALAAVAAAWWIGRASVDGPDDESETIVVSRPTYSSGWQDRAFFDRGYERAGKVVRADADAGLVAHHLLVIDKIADVFEVMATDESITVVLVSPNHFSVGASAAQVSYGTWKTPYGDVSTNVEAAQALIAAVPALKHEEQAFEKEHGIGAVTPFIARSLPNATFVPIIFDESVEPEIALAIGRAAADLPNTILVASVDMAHYMDTEETAAVDAAVLDILESGCNTPTDCSFENQEIDSNASIRALLAFAASRGAGQWHLTHHGSSLDMGATDNPLDNTSHILGYFTPYE